MNIVENKKVRVGLLIDGFDVPAWEYKMIESIIADNYSNIILIVKRKHSSDRPKKLKEKFQDYIKYFFFKAYNIIESKIFTYSPDAFAIMNYQHLVSDVPIMEVDCVETKFSDSLYDKDIEMIKNYQLDVFIRLGFRILRGEILKSSRLGVWSYHHGDNFHYRGGPAVHWEVLKREREVGSILQILTEDLDGGIVLHRSWSSVQKSVTKTTNNLYWKTAQFIPRKLKELSIKGEVSFIKDHSEKNNQLSFYSDSNYTIPTNLEFLKLFIPFFFEALGHKILKVFNFQQWIMMYAFSKQEGAIMVGYKYKRLLPPKDRYWADPFTVYENGKHFIFFEEVIPQGKLERGHLSVIEIDRKGNITTPQIILKQPYHLSYPFIFNHEGTYFMIPETEENNTVQLYECIDFPLQWKFKMNLMENVKAVDTTLLIKDNKFWLFTSICATEGAPYSDELFLFSSDELFTNNWKPHPLNPIVSDVKSARSAGKIFKRNNKFYRPSQDCSFRYGYATIINEIIELNDEQYCEKEVTAIKPDWSPDLLAAHTFNYDNGLSVIDVNVLRKKRFLFLN